MKILAIQDYLRMGGTETQFLDLTARWARAGHEVKRLVFRREGELLATANRDGPAPEFLQPFSSPWNWWAPGLRRSVKSFAPDRIICFGRNAHWAFGRKFRAERISGLVATLRTGRALPSGYRRILSSSEAVVSNSSFAASLAGEPGAEEDRIFVIENGCRLANRSLPDREECRASLEVGEEDCLLICLGSFVPGKAQERLLGIWRQVNPEARRRIRLWFIGDGPRRKSLEASFRSLPDSDRIHFCGNRSDPERFLVAADGMVSVSREESSPNALVEGLWCGVPIGATRCAGVEELVSEEAGGILVEDSEKGESDLADWIRTHPEERARRKRLAEGYQTQAHSRFDPEERAKEYLDLFEKLGTFPQ